MAIGIHVARTGLFTVDQSNNRIDKNAASTTINQLKNTHHEFLVLPDASIPNSLGYPTIKAYLESEANDNFVLSHMDQTMIVTYNQADMNSVSNG